MAFSADELLSPDRNRCGVEDRMILSAVLDTVDALRRELDRARVLLEQSMAQLIRESKTDHGWNLAYRCSVLSFDVGIKSRCVQEALVSGRRSFARTPVDERSPEQASRQCFGVDKPRD
jgi:hypothetical protein